MSSLFFFDFSTILSAMQEFSEVLCDEFLEDEKFDYQLWSKYFNLCASFVTLPFLQLELMPKAKASEIIEKSVLSRVIEQECDTFC